MISLKKIKHLYDPRTPHGVSELSLDISKGSFNAIIGPSGSGKSTLLKILSKEIIPQSGEVSLPEKSQIVFTTELDLEDKKLTVLEYLVSKYSQDKNQRDEAINFARDLLHEFEITHVISQPVGHLSRGEGQRLWLAGLLMSRPEVILLDEAFNGLDWQNRHIMMTSLLEFATERKITIIWATQLLEDALRYSQNIVLLQYGRIQQTGTPEKLINQPKNRFVAQFVGKKNLVLIPPNLESEFGKIDIKEQINNDRILVLDPFPCGEGSFKAKVLESYYNYGRYVHVLQYKERKYLGYSQHQILPNKMTNFSLDTQNSYLLSEV